MMGHRDKIKKGMETYALLKKNKSGYYPGVRRFYKNKLNRHNRKLVIDSLRSELIYVDEDIFWSNVNNWWPWYEYQRRVKCDQN